LSLIGSWLQIYISCFEISNIIWGCFENIYLYQMRTKEITPTQYADLRGWSLQNVTKHIRAKNELPHVISVKHYSRFYLLEVSESLKVNTIQQSIKNLKKRYENS